MPLQRQDAFFGFDDEDFIQQSERDESHRELYLALAGVSQPSTWPALPGPFCPTVQEIRKAFIYSMAIWTLGQILLQVLMGRSYLSGRSLFGNHFAFELGFILLVFVILLFGAKVTNFINYKFFWLKKNNIPRLHEWSLKMIRWTKMIVGRLYRDVISRNVKLPFDNAFDAIHPTIRRILAQNVQIVDKTADVLRLMRVLCVY